MIDLSSAQFKRQILKICWQLSTLRKYMRDAAKLLFKSLVLVCSTSTNEY